MNRRELLKMIAAVTGTAVIGGDLLLMGCKSGSDTSLEFTEKQIALMDEIGETIIPATDTPGAKAARIGEFMKVIVNDCYRPEEQNIFKEGLISVEKLAKKEYGKSYMDMDARQRHDLLVMLEKEAKAYNQKRDLDDKIRKEAFEKSNNGLPWKDRKDFQPTPSHYYTMLKQITLWGYFTSEIGMTKALRHLPVPGHYDGSMAYNGEKAWSE